MQPFCGLCSITVALTALSFCFASHPTSQQNYTINTMKKKLLPNGYRRLTPTEKVKEGDYMTASFNLNYYRERGKQTVFDIS